MPKVGAYQSSLRRLGDLSRHLSFIYLGPNRFPKRCFKGTVIYRAN